MILLNNWGILLREFVSLSDLESADFLTFFSFSAESWGGEERMAWSPRADSAVAPVLISVSSHRERLGRPADDICADEICAN